MKNLLKLLTISLFVTLTSCVNDQTYDAPDLSGECTDLTPTKDVSFFTNLATTSYAQHTGEDIIEAYVTSSDVGGNFYKSISFVSVDGTVGFSVPIDDYNLYTKYEPGRKVFVNMKDRYFVKENNSTVIGSLYNGNTLEDTSDDEVGRISPVEYQSVLTRSCTKVDEDELVNHFTIAQALNNNHLNKLVELDNVQFTDASLNKKFYDPTVNSVGGATNHSVVDAAGTTIIVRVSEFATFAAANIPSGNGKLRGVLTKFGSTFQFMIRSLDDVQLTGPRVLPLFEETFSSSTTFANWAKPSVIGSGQVWQLNSAAGNPASCADMNGYSGSAQNNEDWLISPSINLTTAPTATLTFQTQRPFSGTNLQVYVSTNYVAPNPASPPLPSTATWTLLTGYSLSTSGTTWWNSGNVSLNAYVGNPNVRIAFKYVSTTAGASQWRVDNVKVN
jgi:hypothetical protein